MRSPGRGSAADRIRGVCPVLEVPFTSTGAVDERGFTRVVEHVTRSGVSAVMFPGFASEFHKLDEAERDRLTSLLLEITAAADVAAIVSVPDHATVIAVRRARAAVAAGADAINVLPPHFLSPPAAQVLGHVRSLLEAVPATPVILQYAPAQTGVTLSTESILGLAERHDNLGHIKVEAIPPGPVVSALSPDRSRIACLVGHAGLHLPDALRRGAVGVQPGCSFVEVYVEIWNRWESGRVDSALELHKRLLPYLTYWMQSVELIIQVEKTISRCRGLIESDHCRSPGRPLDDHEQALVQGFLEEFDDVLR